MLPVSTQLGVQHPSFTGRIVWLLAGYADKIEKVLEMDDGLLSRFETVYVFRDYSYDELLLLLLTGLLSEPRWRQEDQKWARVAARRLARCPFCRVPHENAWLQSGAADDLHAC
jgi:hypothetical protein